MTTDRPKFWPQDERGMALTLALLAIVVIGALIGGTFAFGLLDMNGGRMANYGRQAGEVAEAGLAEVLANWPREFNQMAVGTDSVLPTVTYGGNVRYSPRLYRMTGGHYLLRVQGERLGGGGQVLTRREVGQYIRLFLPTLDIRAALTATGNVTIRGSASVDGNENPPGGWTGCPAGAPVAGVRTDSTTTTSGPIHVTGSPATITSDPTVVDSIFTTPLATLIPYATKTLAGGSYNGMAPVVSGSPSVCNTANSMNWGEPYRPPTAGVVPQCYTYFPIILVNGSVTLQSGRGQGILLVTGDVSLRGNFEFDGVIITDGALSTQGTGNKVSGGILAHYADSFSPTASGNPDVLYSSCAIHNALQYSAHAVPLGQRAWSQRYQ
jgi:hypothetical protein